MFGSITEYDELNFSSNFLVHKHVVHVLFCPTYVNFMKLNNSIAYICGCVDGKLEIQVSLPLSHSHIQDIESVSIVCQVIRLFRKGISYL